MFEIKDSGLIIAKDRNELIEGLVLKCCCPSGATIYPSGVTIYIDTVRLLGIHCKCGKYFEWRYKSKIPNDDFNCNCGNLLISYIINKKYRFISR